MFFTEAFRRLRQTVGGEFTAFDIYFNFVELADIAHINGAAEFNDAWIPAAQPEL